MTETGGGDRRRDRDDAARRRDDPADSGDSPETFADGGAVGPEDDDRVRGDGGRARPRDDDDDDDGDDGEGPETLLYGTGQHPLEDSRPPETQDGPGARPETEDDRATVTGGFAATALPRPPGGVTAGPAGDGETVFDAGLTERLKDRAATQADPVAGTRRDPGTRTNVPRARGARDQSATARDMAAPHVSSTGMPRAASGPIKLVEGEILAGRYELLRRLGKGGMGEVWKARHTLLHGNRAIKVIKASISRDKTFRARFLTEGQTMMSIKHPGVVEVTDLAETRQDGELFMVMEHLEGRTLYDAIRDGDHPLCEDIRTTIRIYKEVADGMQRIHDERIVHKDLKSDNVLLVKGDDLAEHPKVIDFGLAKRLEDPDARPIEDDAAAVSGSYEGDLRTTLSGTLAYMAPEQFKEQPSSFQSDIYAFGVMLYEAFMRGKYPLPRGGLAEYLKMHAQGATPARLSDDRPDLDRTIARIADRCMAPAKADRPESFFDVAHDLQWWLDAPERRAKRKRRLLISGAFVLLAAIAVAGFFLGDTIPSLSDVEVASGTETIARATWGGKRVHLREDRLADLKFTAFLSGIPADPALSVDGEPVEAQIERATNEGGREVLIAHADLSHLADGPHDVGFRAAANGEDAILPIVVDREPPPIADVRVAGAIGGVTNAGAPVVLVEVDEATVDTVVAHVRGTREPAPGAMVRENDRREWSILGTAKKLGTVRFEVVARDLAGNVSRRDFSYEWDTVPPTLTVRDLVEGVLQARESTSAELRVTASEPGAFSVTFGGGAALETALERAGEATFDVPVIPQGGFDAKITFTDAAGNAAVRTVPVKYVRDQVTLATTDGKAALVARGDEPVRLLVTRSYPLETAGNALEKLYATRLDKPGGAAAGDAVDLAVVPGAGSERSVPVDAAAADLRALGDGFYQLMPTGQSGAAATGLLLTIDSTNPRVADTRVRDADGREIGAGEWSHSQIVTVEVDVDDLLPASVRLTGAGRVKPLFQDMRVGLETYAFEVSLTDQGRSSFTVNVVDTAGNTDERPLTINADWVSPTLTLSTPEPGGLFNDKAPVTIAGTCSEESYTLTVTSSGGEAPRESAHESAAFSVGYQFRVGNPSITVVATDRSGRKSPPRTVAIRVEELKTELPPEIDWTTGVTVKMERVPPGDVYVAKKVQSVGLVYVDKTEVTNAQYRTFLAASAGRPDWDHPEQPAGWDHTPSAETWGDARWNSDQLPVVNVSFWDAWAFAKWSGDRRLPTEAEWVKAAAKVEGEGDLLRWPTGNDADAGLLLVTRETVGEGDAALPVTASEGTDVSPIGCLHMGGNVSEWVTLPAAAAAETPGAAVRGGSWCFTRVAANVRDTPAKVYERDLRSPTIGFRCAVDGEKVKP